MLLSFRLTFIVIHTHIETKRQQDFDQAFRFYSQVLSLFTMFMKRTQKISMDTKIRRHKNK